MEGNSPLNHPVKRPSGLLGNYHVWGPVSVKSTKHVVIPPFIKLPSTLQPSRNGLEKEKCALLESEFRRCAKSSSF